MLKYIKKIDFFIPSLLAAIAIAKLFPEPAVYEGVVTLDTISNIGIMMVFLFYGIKINPKRLKTDLGNWKLHLTVQLSTFLLFPLIVLPFTIIFKNHDSYLLWLGAFFLAALPSTVSSSVVLISIAKGNIPGGIFNASISSLLGVFITPLWMGIIITSGHGIHSAELIDIITKLVIQILSPVILGFFLNRFFGKWAGRNATPLKIFDQSVILLVIYLSFAHSFSNNQFRLVAITDIIMVVLFCLLLLFIVYRIITFICKLLKFHREDTITAQFSGSKKSLVHGTVMSAVIFAGITGVGVILLPLMIYHTMQLMVIGAVAQRKAREVNE